MKSGVIVKLYCWRISTVRSVILVGPLAAGGKPGLARLVCRLLGAALALSLCGKMSTLAQMPDSNGVTSLVPISMSTKAVPASPESPTNSLCLNFHGAPVSLVLEYLSEAGSFVISQEMELREPVDLSSNGPVTRDEAVDLLNASLRRQGCIVTRKGRILTVTRLDRDRTSDLEIVTGNDPEAVARSDEAVTQIIPVRYANVSQLVKNLQPLLPASALLSANESANALILVATGTDVRRMLKIISALDNAIARVSSIKVFPLQHADAKELATVVQQLLGDQVAGQIATGGGAGIQSFGPPGGGGMGPPGSPEPPSAAEGSARTETAAARMKLTAVADERANCLVVCASEGLLPAVADLIHRLDQRVGDTTVLRVFRLRNADASELAEQLAQLFPEETASGRGQGEAGFSFGEPPLPGGGPPEAGNSESQSEGSGTQTKRTRVLTVADARTSSLVVSAASSLMPQIAALIDRLDADRGRKELVGYWDLRNADPQDVKQVLQCLFNRNNRAQNEDNLLLGQNNPLTARQTQQQSTTMSSKLQPGNSGRSGGGGQGSGF
jgi:type II secretory pathway component GspD/PulD (secretin)